VPKPGQLRSIMELLEAHGARLSRHLSPKERETLKVWMGAASWKSFEEFAALISGPKWAEKLRLNTSKQLHTGRWSKTAARKMVDQAKYWKPFQNQIQRTRFLVSTELRSRMNAHNLSVIEGLNVGTIEQRGARDPKEIIFLAWAMAFESCIVIDSVAGDDEGIWLFDRTPTTESFLLEQSTISYAEMSRITGLHGRHDHKHLWQVNLPHWLHHWGNVALVQKASKHRHQNTHGSEIDKNRIRKWADKRGQNPKLLMQWRWE